MNPEYRQRINQQYLNSRVDSTPLFETIREVASVVGMDQALAILEDCVMQKRLAWVAQNLAAVERSGDPLRDGYHAFYEVYLGVSVPAEGEIVSVAEKRMVTRWWNRCPTLEACQALGLDTRLVCKQVYHRPVEALLQGIDPRLRFDRNYENLRPYGACCEEIIYIQEER